MKKKLFKTRVSKIMQKGVHPLSPGDSLTTLVKRFLKESASSLPVVDEKGVFIGEILRVDLLKTCVDLRDISLATISEFGSKLDRGYSAQTAADLIVTKDRTLRRTATVEEAILIMLKEGDSAIPVLDPRGCLKGIITDLLLLRHAYRLKK